ncbi:MAG: response regulator [Desulfobacterales bacterium]|nr:response regulator [Desulfobacterales bacterium]
MAERRKILVVDDSAVIRKIIRNELEGGRYKIEEAENGEKALQMVSSGRPPDLITLDLDMPVMNGFETCRKLQEPEYSRYFVHLENQSVPIIFVTANDNLADRRKGFELGATDFITKPFMKGDILAAVNGILRPDVQLKDLTALVVDDSKTARLVVSRILKKKGLKVFQAENGIQAFEFMCNRMAEIDILVTDLVMPGMDGRELCEKVRKELNLQDIPIVFLTGTTEKSELIDLFKAGGTDYIVKPFLKEEFLARLVVHLERARLNDRLRSTVSELRSLNKMKDSLISVCSHDLRTPLNGILGFTEMMLEKEEMPEDDRRSLFEIKSSGELLLDLINDILDLSKIQADKGELEKEPVPAADLVRTSFRAMKPIAVNKRQKIRMKSNCPDGVIMANRTEMIRVINNLLSNAIKFTPENGRIDLAIDPGPDNHLIVSVTDNGIGIPKDKIPYLFDKFTKTSQSGTSGEKGTGLGMSIVKEIVEIHGGRVEVTSEEGRGASFKLIIPKTEDEPSETPSDEKRLNFARAPRKMAAPAKPGVCRILVADDNPINVKVAKRMLTRDGHEVTVAENGRQALTAGRRKRFDLILMDMQMPEMDGLEATRKLRSSGASDVPIIALTANTGEKNIDACLKAGMNDFLSKPFKPKELRAKISKWRGKLPRPPSSR